MPRASLDEEANLRPRDSHLVLYESLTFLAPRWHDDDKASCSGQIPGAKSVAEGRRLTPGQFSDRRRGLHCVNVGKAYVHPLSVKSNSPEGPLRHVPYRHTVYFFYRDPYYAVAER